jgi:hypothetical protein
LWTQASNNISISVLNYSKCTRLRQNVHSRGLFVQCLGTWELSVLLAQVLYKTKIFMKNNVLIFKESYHRTMVSKQNAHNLNFVSWWPDSVPCHWGLSPFQSARKISTGCWNHHCQFLDLKPRNQIEHLSDVPGLAMKYLGKL